MLYRTCFYRCDNIKIKTVLLLLNNANFISQGVKISLTVYNQYSKGLDTWPVRVLAHEPLRLTRP